MIALQSTDSQYCKLSNALEKSVSIAQRLAYCQYTFYKENTNTFTSFEKCRL